MKQGIHPTYYPDAQVICACGNTWTTGSTKKLIGTDVGSKCHPFFTGEQRIVDTEGQVDRFYKKLQARQQYMEDAAAREAARTSLDRPIAELDLGTRATEALANAGVVNVGQAMGVGPMEQTQQLFRLIQHSEPTSVSWPAPRDQIPPFLHTNSPDLAVLEARAEVAEAQVRAARQIDNPQLRQTNFNIDEAGTCPQSAKCDVPYVPHSVLYFRGSLGAGPDDGVTGSGTMVFVDLQPCRTLMPDVSSCSVSRTRRTASSRAVTGGRRSELLDPIATRSSWSHWNWLTAPIGSLTSLANGWNSGIRALTANGERVLMALNTDPTNGPLAMFSPRWQQLTGANEGSLWGVRKVFLARGRAFLATGDRLVTLQPDGITWDDRALAGVKSVVGDQQGRIWIGAGDGVRRWTSAGWDMIDGALGTPPAGPINAIAVDAKNRVWIGGEAGLTLFDRERWVTTIQPPQGAISVTAVLVDGTTTCGSAPRKGWAESAPPISRGRRTPPPIICLPITSSISRR